MVPMLVLGNNQSIDRLTPADPFELPVELCLWMIWITVVIFICILVIFLFQDVCNAGLCEGHLQVLQGKAKSKC